MNMAHKELIYKDDVRRAVLKANPQMVWCLEGLGCVDAVEVVRCKDCKWFNRAGCAIYIVDDSEKPKEDDFCSYGERRDDGTQKL